MNIGDDVWKGIVEEERSMSNVQEGSETGEAELAVHEENDRSRSSSPSQHSSIADYYD